MVADGPEGGPKEGIVSELRDGVSDPVEENDGMAWARSENNAAIAADTSS
jgi:hypothetical protein